jgi:hypothetical protein
MFPICKCSCEDITVTKLDEKIVFLNKYRANGTGCNFNATLDLLKSMSYCVFWL